MSALPLAIVIPAWKARFLDATLRSIAAQDRREFVVHVGDDASSDDLGAICRRWDGTIDLRYVRFADNRGGSDLVAQWRRCVELSSAPWVWLFSDDDLMPPDAVARLLQAVAVEGSRHDLFHFDVEQIDAEGRPIAAGPAFAPRLSVREFALRRMRFQLFSYAPDYVFSRPAYDRLGGFVPFARGWGSDDATWIRLGARGGIRTLPGARVQWRSSGSNISSGHVGDAAEKLRAQLELLTWIDGFLRDHPAAPGEPSDAEILGSAHDWFFAQARLLRVPFFPRHATTTLGALSRVRCLSRTAALWAMLRADLRLWNAARLRSRATAARRAA